MKRAWQAIHDGAKGCIETAVEAFVNQYARYILKAKPYEVSKLTGQRVFDSFKQTGESAGALDGWSPKELSLLSLGACVKIANMLNQIE